MSKEVDELFEDEITTGATLSSGTTIGGNKVYHLGNDGQGSGLDAETVDGSTVVQKGVEYTRNEKYTTNTAGSIISQFSGTGTGVGVDSDESIWYVRNGYHVKNDQSGTTMSSFTAPSNETKGIGATPDNCIWSSQGGTTDSIYKFDHSGTLQKKFSSPCLGPWGIDGDSDGCLWIMNNGQKSIYKVNQSGSVKSSIASPSAGCRGVGVTSRGSIWTPNRDAGSIYEVDRSGTITQTFAEISPNPKGLGVDKKDNLWIGGDNDGSTYEVASGEEYQGIEIQKL